ncbi:hypothetical protein GCM10007198_27680 [Microbacterium aerolatum]|uniref:Uncharacterized protein n=1 Tax=Microbacterium aerolatum TaxID=153731 RepID=A0A511AIA4_9MICO|nr:hypothetical protein MAE01_22290 [Microbacterium aerolatum]GGB35602.1 hypothetical protein GCM10007198_27680 [Microbacterium aerolatum]
MVAEHSEPRATPPHVQLTGDLAVVQHHERVSAAVAVLLQEPADAQTHVEARRAAGDRRLPALQPRAIVQQLLLQDARVTGPDEPQLDRAVTVSLQQFHAIPAVRELRGPR